AWGPEEGRFVDIRRIPRSEGVQMRDVERLTNAGFAAMELRHPRIAAVLDVVVGATEIAIVSEHVSGAILQALGRPGNAKRVSVPIGVASRIALDLLEAIDAVRAPWDELFPTADSAEERLLKACVHGGLLPDGLLVATFGETMLLEAGLAGVALTIPTILDHPDVIAYRAPEQLEPGRVIDERADVFTIGILLWEMLAGRSLFGPSVLPRPAAGLAVGRSGSDPVQVSAARRRVLSQPIARLDALPLLKGKVSKELADAVARCLERDPALRFQTVRDAIHVFSTLDGESLSRHGAVGTFITSLGIAELREPKPEESEGPSSNRPTTPPAENISVHPPGATDEGLTRSFVAARRGPLREPDTEKSPERAARGLAVTATMNVAELPAQSESVAPTTELDSIPPFVESTPPPVDTAETPTSTIDLDTLPPLAAVEVARAQIGGAEGSITLLSGVAPPDSPKPAPNRVDSLPEHDGSLHEVATGPRSDERTPAPVLSTDSDVAGIRAGFTAAGDEPVFSERRDRSKKVVVAVMAGAAVLVLIAVLRVVLSQGSSPAAASAEPAVATPEVVSAESEPASAAADPALRPADTRVSAPAESATTAPETPTSAPAGATPAPPELAPRRPSKKHPYRPSSI
ncbi:MAG TPA: hypothetical protein VHU80_06995, partial [Polyangiaceae bacterium]|nr:hypothetical protein [Polyangiaceae bacterium]